MKLLIWGMPAETCKDSMIIWIIWIGWNHCQLKIIV